MRAVTALDEPTLHAAYWAHRHDYDRGALTGPAYWHAVAAHAGIALDAGQIDALIHADTDLWTHLNPPMVEWAQRLQCSGVRTGILSNIGDSIAEGICAKLPWLAAFDHCTWSHALSLAKPDPAIYLRTAEALRLPPTEILFIDDRADNIAAAAVLGFHTVRYTTHPAFEHDMRALGHGWLLTVGTPSAGPIPK
jgi:putative hydrolase of the HAD superfamily